jgi:hypothetical protein
MEQLELSFDAPAGQEDSGGGFEGQEGVTSQVQAPSAPRNAVLNIDGHSMEVSEATLKNFYGIPANEQVSEKEWKTMVSAYKAHKRADINTEKFKRNDKLVFDFANLLQHNPEELLKRAGHDPRRFAEEVLSRYIEEDMLPEEQKQIRNLQREKEELEASLNEERTKQEQQQMEYLQAEAEKEITQGIISALDSSKLPKTPDVIRRIAYYMMKAHQKNIPVQPKHIIPIVQEDLRVVNRAILDSLDEEGLMEYLGEEKIKKLRQAELKKIKKPMQFADNTGRSEGQVAKTEKKGLSRDEFRQLVKRNAGA